MSSRTEELRQQKEAQAKEIKSLTERLDVRLNRMSNWRTLTNDYPFQTLLASAALGFFLANGGGVISKLLWGQAKGMAKAGAALYLLNLAQSKNNNNVLDVRTY